MKRSWIYNNTSFSELKRKIYLVVLPVLLLTFVIVFIFGYLYDGVSSIVVIIFFILFLVFTLCYFFLLIKKSHLFIIEMTTCLMASFVFLLGMYDAIIQSLGVRGNVHLGPIAYWTPVLFILFYFTFRGFVALIFSLITFSFTIALGVHHILYSPFSSAASLFTLLQYFFASLVTIIALYYFQRIIEIYLEAEVSYEKAYTDFLTDLPNRRRMEQLLQEEMDKARRNETTLSVILFDIDLFKIINDTYGHDMGDIALKELAQTVKENIRDTDYFGRWGGEEFLIIATRKNLIDGAVLAERMRELVANREHDHLGYITCSFGVAELQKNDSALGLIKRADLALYKAKKGGRNQVRTS